MKRVFLTLFVLLPAVAIGQSGSSQVGPLHLPFEFNITANGAILMNYIVQPYDTILSNFSLDLFINSGDTNFHLNNDTILCNKTQNLQGHGGAAVEHSYFRMIFDTATKAIQDLTLEEDSAGNQFLGGWSTSTSFELINLDYDSTSIFSPDSDLNNHLKAAYYSSYSEEPSGNPPPDEDSSLYVTSIHLSGNFRPTTLTEGVAIPTQEQSTMSFLNDNGTEFCTFPTTDHHRTLEFYTPLGSKAGTVDVPAGAAQVALPTLTRGLYFVRMDGSVLKVAIR